MKKSGKAANSQTRSIRTLSRKDAPHNESKRNNETGTYQNSTGFLPSSSGNHGVQDRASSLMNRNAYGAVQSGKQ